MWKRRLIMTIMLVVGLVLSGCVGAPKTAGLADQQGPTGTTRQQAISACPATLSYSTPYSGTPLLSASLRAASGMTIGFQTQNGVTINGKPPQALDLPELVLYRNGVLTHPDERTLIVEVSGLSVPPAGAVVTLELETQHGDPDLGGDANAGLRIPVWRETRRITNTGGFTQTGVTTISTREFTATVDLDGEPVPTPTDYYRLNVAVVDAEHPITDPLYSFEADYALLIENQWIAQLPEVQEVSDGAAPGELIIYSCDMFPFRRSTYDRSTWLRRAQVNDYIAHELLPRMVEAFRIETDDWGFPWHDAWTSWRAGADAERLSIALGEGQTWFHGFAPFKGYADISIGVAGYNKDYESLTDALMSTFYHELFHNLQRNINLHHGGSGDVAGKEDAWGFFSEGTAVLASAVGQPRVQFAQAARTRAYLSNANDFLRDDGVFRDLNTGYGGMYAYHTALYWRFLYEQCGGMWDGIEDPGAGMDVIRRALEVLYSGDILDISTSTDLVGKLPEIMDRVLEESSCPFSTHAQSLTAFARAIYALRLEGGRCTAPGTPIGCGFYDPHGLYLDPPVGSLTYFGETLTFATTDQPKQNKVLRPMGSVRAADDAPADQPHPVGIPSSFGVDFLEVGLDAVTQGQPLMIRFQGQGEVARFHVQVWQLKEEEQGLRAVTPGPEPLEPAPDGAAVCHIPSVDTAIYDHLALIITRLDADEARDPGGNYTITLQPLD